MAHAIGMRAESLMNLGTGFKGNQRWGGGVRSPGWHQQKAVLSLHRKGKGRARFLEAARTAAAVKAAQWELKREEMMCEV